MNEIVNIFLKVGQRFMCEMHLIRPGFTYSTCGPCTKNKETIQKFKEIGDSKYIYRNELDKARFQHDMAYGNFKYLLRRRPSDKVSREKAFNIAKNPKYDGYQRGLAPMVYKCFDKNSDLLTDKSTASGTVLNQQLDEELHKPVIRKFRKLKVQYSFTDNII